MSSKQTPHPHAETIRAWADGATIEYRVKPGDEWLETTYPSWAVGVEYRVKPEAPTKAQECSLSAGEKALINALRKSEIEHVWEAKSAFLTAESTYHDFIAFMTAGDATVDDDIRAALNTISREQGKEISDDV